ncbi:MAG: hypothetical protein ABIR91_05625 [Candidatus Saccharimonadales bacterium]
MDVSKYENHHRIPRSREARNPDNGRGELKIPKQRNDTKALERLAKQEAKRATAHQLQVVKTSNRVVATLKNAAAEGDVIVNETWYALITIAAQRIGMVKRCVNIEELSNRKLIGWRKYVPQEHQNLIKEALLLAMDDGRIIVTTHGRDRVTLSFPDTNATATDTNVDVRADITAHTTADNIILSPDLDDIAYGKLTPDIIARCRNWGEPI